MERLLEKSDRSEASARSMRLLDSVNFFVAAVQTGFGAFVTVYLVKSAWPPAVIGLALTIATMSTLVSQMPAGALIDSVHDKRWPVLFGMAGVGLAALLLGLTAVKPAVYLALAVQGLSSALIAPGIAAISLALVGESGLIPSLADSDSFGDSPTRA
jgi:MFS family permease